jgi:hypothetical protein
LSGPCSKLIIAAAHGLTLGSATFGQRSWKPLPPLCTGSPTSKPLQTIAELGGQLAAT